MSVEFRDQLLSVQEFKTAKNTNDDILSIRFKDKSIRKEFIGHVTEEDEEMKNLNLFKYIFYFSAEPESERNVLLIIKH